MKSAPRASKTATTPATTQPEQDTPGRPKEGSSRQQKHPAQGAQTGSKELDEESAHGALPRTLHPPKDGRR